MLDAGASGAMEPFRSRHITNTQGSYSSFCIFPPRLLAASGADIGHDQYGEQVVCHVLWLTPESKKDKNKSQINVYKGTNSVVPY